MCSEWPYGWGSKRSPAPWLVTMSRMWCGRGRSMSGWLGAPDLLPTLLPTQAQPGTTKTLLLAVLLGRFAVLCCAWVVLVVVDPLSGASYESVGRRFDSCRAHQPFNDLRASPPPGGGSCCQSATSRLVRRDEPFVQEGPRSRSGSAPAATVGRMAPSVTDSLDFSRMRWVTYGNACIRGSARSRDSSGLRCSRCRGKPSSRAFRANSIPLSRCPMSS